MKYPTPLIFKDLFENSESFSDETNHWLEQISLQAKFGKLALAFLIEQLRTGDSEILQRLPIPKTILTEDGYKGCGQK